MNGATPVSKFVSCLKSVLGDTNRPIALHEPEFSGNERKYVQDCLDTGWVSAVGRYVDEFESQLATYTGATYAVAVVNGTAALHVALRVAGVERDDEVLVPALTFVATANAVSHCGAIPHFVDSSATTFGLDPAALAEYLAHIAEPVAAGFRNRLTGRRLAAVVPMHAFGQPVDMEALLEVAARYKLVVVEDAAESLGSRIGSRHTGTFGRMGVLSFNGNKVITTGGGGAILTNDQDIARKLKHLTTTAKLPHRWEFVHDEVAYNYRMPNLNAALGCAQLERLPSFLLQKRKLAEEYADAFADVKEFQIALEQPGCTSNYWLNVVRIVDGDFEQRDALLLAATDAGYQCRPAWRLMNRLPMYENCPRAELPVAQRLEQSLINLPSSAALAARLPSADN